MTLPDRPPPYAAVRALRTVVFGIWFVKTALDPLQSLARLPISLYEPVGFLTLVPAGAEPLLIETPFLYALKGTTLLALGLVLAGVGRTAGAIVACLLITLQQGIVRGFSGHIHHGDLVLLYAAYLLALFPLADAVARKQETSPRTGPMASSERVLITAVLTALCLSYTLTGTYRFIHGGIETFRTGSATFWALRNAYQVVDPAWGWGKLLLDAPLLSHMLDASFPLVTAMEAAGIAALIVRPFRWVFLASMIGLHFVSWLFLEVFFWENMILFGFFLERRSQTAAATP